MTDWLEELLAGADEERREEETLSPGDVPAVPAPKRKGRTAASGEEKAPERAERSERPAGAGEVPAAPPLGEDPPGTAAQGAAPVEERPGGAREEPPILWSAAPAALARRETGWPGTAAPPEGEGGPPGAAERAAPAETLPLGAGAAPREEESDIGALYRETARAVRPVQEPLPAAAGPGAARRETDGAVPGLSPEELDRAVRRDSRRYDGAMTIF